MDGDFEQKFQAAEDIPPLADFTGDAIGLNLRLSWIGNTPITNLMYSLTVSGSNYRFESDNTDIGDIEETTVNFTTGVDYRFDL